MRIGGALILMYHRIATAPADPWSLCVSPASFAEHLAVIATKCSPVRLGRLTTPVSRALTPRRSIAVTFDDGYADNVHRALPLLEQYEVPATMFVATGHVGTPREFWWDTLERALLWPRALPDELVLDVGGERHRWELGPDAHYDETAARRHRQWTTAALPPTARHLVYHQAWQLLQQASAEDRDLGMAAICRWSGVEPDADSTTAILSEDDVGTLARSRLIEIGAHTITHPALANCSPVAQRLEIGGSQTRLEELTGAPVVSFSYPYGSHSPVTRMIVRDAGYRRACTTHPTGVTLRSDAFALPRLQVADWAGDEFERRLLDWLP